MSKQNKIEINYVPVADIVPYANNAWDHDEQQITDLASQIATYGWDQPIVLTTSNVIIKGHARLAAAKKLKMEEVPVVYTTLDEYEAMAARIADNQLSIRRKINNDKLKFDLKTLQNQKINLNLTGMREIELKPLIESDLVSKQIIGDAPGSAAPISEPGAVALDSSSEEAPTPSGETITDDSSEFFMQKKPVISYNIIFDNEEQQEQWNEFLKALKDNYPTLETIAERLVQHIEDTRVYA